MIISLFMGQTPAAAAADYIAAEPADHFAAEPADCFAAEYAEYADQQHEYAAHERGQLLMNHFFVLRGFRGPSL
jgi:hypothetical protein